MIETPERRRAWAILVARTMLGLIFGMAGFWKVFTLTPLQHARRLFVIPYAATILPVWLLWTAGTVIPFVELIGGMLLFAGWRTREALVALGGLLVIVTFGHLLLDPLYEFHTHVIPRTALLLFLLLQPADADRWSMDGWRRRAQSP